MPDFELDGGPAYGESGEGEDLDFEIAFYEGIVERLPDSIDVLMALGNDYTRSGCFEKGLHVDERLCELRTRDPIVHYNLACSYSLLGHAVKAVEALQKAIAYGYRDFVHLQRDPDLEPIRKDPAYLALVKRVRQHELRS
jgi:tetratricopeptide (TPR) repeat protein